MDLKLERLNKSYSGLKATDEVSLEVSSQSLHALIGPNGAGKTTLIRQISGEIFPDSGHIFLGNQEITRMKDYQRASSGLVRTFQISSTFTENTLAENVSLAVQAHQKKFFGFWKNGHKDQEILADCNELLKRFDLVGYKDTRVKDLSHGLTRQMELAMAMALRPKVLLLDEPAAGLGIEESKKLLTLLKKIKGDFTILLIEHDMDLVFEVADLISVLDLGKVLVTDIPSKIQTHSTVKEIYLGQTA